MIQELSFGIFFLYFVIMSSVSFKLLNCNLQRFLVNNVWVKQLFVFFSIFLFTFILRWYSLDPLDNYVENFENIKKYISNYKLSNKSDDYIKNSVLYTFLIYIVFILSTKNEGIYILTFLLICIKLLCLNIYLFLVDKSIYDNIRNNLFIFGNKQKYFLNKYKEKKYIKNMIFIHNYIITFSFIALLLLFIGAYFYYLRQYKEHKKNWSWLIFWFGTNYGCKNID